MSFLKDKDIFLISVGLIFVIFFIYTKIIDFIFYLKNMYDEIDRLEQLIFITKLKIDKLYMNDINKESIFYI